MSHDNPCRLNAVRLNTKLVSACAVGDLATVRELLPDTRSTIRGAPERLNRVRKEQWAYPVDDDVALMYDFEAFWFDLDARPYGRNRKYGTGHMQWDYCEENSEFPDLVGHTALTAASQNGHVVILEHLCSVTPIMPHLNRTGERRYKHVISSSRSRGDGPCHLAVKGGHWKSLRQLIQHAHLSTRGALNPLFTRNHDMLTPCNVGSSVLRRLKFRMDVSLSANIRMCMLLLECYGNSCSDFRCIAAPFRAVLDTAKAKRWQSDIASYWNTSQIKKRSAQICPLLLEVLSCDVSKIIVEYDVELAPEYLLISPLPHDVVDAFFYAMTKMLPNIALE